ncbi:MAG TPA: NADH-quinone oxidoreductase subunit N [Candidatus Sulfotelmatobacter sp.]|nr:NADH-quinone oxidoreductase subunit N [Candidatus Sulfotelmatobacter sp.]
MADFIDVILPIASLAIFAVLTVPIFRLIRKSKRTTGFSLIWFAIVFATVFATISNLALKYYTTVSPQPLNITLAQTPLASLSTAFMIDAISIYMAIIISTVSAVVFLYGIFYVKLSERPSERYYAIMLMLTAALIGTVFSGDLLTLFIFWEAAAAGSSFLMIFRKKPESLNAALKYLVMIIIASAFIIFGISLVYGLTGSLNFWAVREALISLADKRLLVLAFIFIATGYAIEAAIVPFHFWLPDAYNAAPASSSAFLSALIDQGSYYVLIRVLIFILVPTQVLDWRFMLAVMASLTMIVGNLFALIQDDIKRLIGNICVADVGYNLVAITSVSVLGMEGNLYFFLIGGITTALAFMSVGIINHYGFKSMDDFSGLGWKMPLACLALSMAAFSFAGIPPFGGFTAKLLVFTAAIQSNMAWLAIIGVIASVLQTAYLFRLINVIWAKKPKDETKIKEPIRLLIPVFILIAAIIILGLFPNIVLNLIGQNQLPFPIVG